MSKLENPFLFTCCHISMQFHRLFHLSGIHFPLLHTRELSLRLQDRVQTWLSYEAFPSFFKHLLRSPDCAPLEISFLGFLTILSLQHQQGDWLKRAPKEWWVNKWSVSRKLTVYWGIRENKSYLIQKVGHERAKKKKWLKVLWGFGGWEKSGSKAKKHEGNDIG